MQKTNMVTKGEGGAQTLPDPVNNSLVFCGGSSFLAAWKKERTWHLSALSWIFKQSPSPPNPQITWCFQFLNLWMEWEDRGVEKISLLIILHPFQTPMFHSAKIVLYLLQFPSISPCLLLCLLLSSCPYEFKPLKLLVWTECSCPLKIHMLQP